MSGLYQGLHVAASWGSHVLDSPACQCDKDAGGGTCEASTCEASGPACAGPGLSTFADNFNRPDGALASPYLTDTGLPLANATIMSDEVCGLDHDPALVQINPVAHKLIVSYDFSGPTSGLETEAVAYDMCSGNIVVAGLNAGANLQIQAINFTTGAPGFGVQSPDSFALQPNTSYHLTAAFDPAGNVTVQLANGSTVISNLAANIGTPVGYHQAGLLIGRGPQDGVDCADNLTIQEE